MVNNHNVTRISLLVEGYPRLGFKVFAQLSKQSSNSICITRLHPDYVAEKFGVRSRKCYWLSGVKGKDIISPKSIGQMVKLIKTQAKEGKPLVLLDGLEYMLLWNDMSKVMSAFSEIDAILAASGGSMVICMDPLTMEQKDLERLTASFPKAENIEAEAVSDPEDAFGVKKERSGSVGMA